MIGWRKLLNESISPYAAFPSNDFLVKTVLPLALLAVLLVVLLLKAVRVWQEIHDVEQPDTPRDLLESFEQAHAAGELDDSEFARVREQLEAGSSARPDTSDS